MRQFFYFLLLLCCVGVALCFGAVLLSGPQLVALGQAYGATLWAGLQGQGFDVATHGAPFLNAFSEQMGLGPEALQAIFELRFSRILACVGLGAGLALCGSVLQRLLRNPLADPYILGLSAGGTTAAVLGSLAGPALLVGWLSPRQQPSTAPGDSVQAAATEGVFSLVSWLGKWGVSWVSLCALAGALLTLGALLALRRRLRHLDESFALPLAGLLLNAFFGATLMLVVALASPAQISEAQRWMLGSVRAVSASELVFLGVCMGTAGGFLLRQAVAIQALAFGDEFATSLGFAARRVRLQALLALAVMVSAAVTLAGSVGFVGLIVPHVALRLHVRSSVALEWKASALLGASALVLADTLARTVALPAELPVGIFTAVLGVPALAAILWQRAGAQARGSATGEGG